MIRAKDLDGRAVVDLESAEKLGYVHEIFLDPDGGEIAAYSIQEHSSLVGGGRHTFVPPSAVESIGPEAIMVRPGTGRDAPTSAPDSFPRLSHITGRKVVTQSGKLVGAINDVLLDEDARRIVGYQLRDAGWTGSIGEHFKSEDDFDYVRADHDLRLSDELLVVPDDAVVHADSGHRDDSAIGALGHRHPTAERTVTREATPVRESTTAFSSVLTPVDTAHPAAPVETTHPSSTLATPAPATTRRWHDVQPDFRSRWERSSGTRGGLWEEHEPAYRYGWEMSHESRFHGRPWDQAEPDLHRDWSERHPDRPWDRFSAAVREAWDSMTDSDDDKHDHVHDAAYETHRAPVRETVRDDDSPRDGYDGTRPLL